MGNSLSLVRLPIDRSSRARRAAWVCGKGRVLFLPPLRRSEAALAAPAVLPAAIASQASRPRFPTHPQRRRCCRRRNPTSD